MFGGDFNAVLKKLDVQKGVGFDSKTCKTLKELIKYSNLLDVFRVLYSGGEEFTWFRLGMAASRLDRFLVSRGLIQDVLIYGHFPSFSDHLAVGIKNGFS